MFNFSFIFSIFVLEFFTGISSESSSYVLPPWIAENPGYKNPKHINSVETSHGSVSGKSPGTAGWVILVNEKNGYGIDIEVSKLCLDSGSDFLIVAPWPLASEFKQIKLFTGIYKQPLKLLIPNTKAFFVLYDASSRTVKQEMVLKYRRYGSSLEYDPPTTETPVKKNTVFEVQLKGKSPKEYSDELFSQKLKEAMREIARQYSLAHDIPFNNIPTQQMVRIHSVSLCPLEWPERDLCASLRHSIFVSGEIVLESRRVMDYELTADHLRDMWKQERFPELEELGVTVFTLPGTTSTVVFWILITGLVIIGSLVASCLFWKADKNAEKTGSKKKSFASDVKEKPGLKSNKFHEMPPFSYDWKLSSQKHDEKSFGEESSSLKMENSLRSDSSPKSPITNYYGSLIFATNAAFEDEEGNPDKES